MQKFIFVCLIAEETSCFFKKCKSQLSIFFLLMLTLFVSVSFL